LIARSLVAAFVSAAFTTSFAASPTPAGTPLPPPRPIQIDRNSALVLIRTTLVALQQANQTGNYSVLYGISAPGFQSVNSPERLAQIFANLRAKAFDLSGVVVLEPQFTVLPELYANGVMRMGGFFPSVPMQVYFDLQFVGVQGQWRLIAISVEVGPATPIAPTAETPGPASTVAAPSTATPTPAPIQSAEPQAAPSVDIGTPKPKTSTGKSAPAPRTSGGLGKSTPMPAPTTSPQS
jgi:hypothetical protein